MPTPPEPTLDERLARTERERLALLTSDPAPRSRPSWGAYLAVGVLSAVVTLLITGPTPAPVSRPVTIVLVDGEVVDAAALCTALDAEGSDSTIPAVLDACRPPTPTTTTVPR